MQLIPHLTAPGLAAIAAMSVLAAFFIGVIWGITWERTFRPPPAAGLAPARSVTPRKHVREELDLFVPVLKTQAIDLTRVMRKP